MTSPTGIAATLRRAVADLDFKTVAPLLVALSGAVATVEIAPAHAQAVTERQILHVLRDNPQLIADAAEVLRRRQMATQADTLLRAVKPVATKVIAGDARVPAIGPANGRPVVEFFDYNCGYCKQFSRGVAAKIVGGPKPVRLHLVLAAILGPGSERMAQLAAAAKLQGRFDRAHAFLMEQSARSAADADALRPRLIAAAGLDKARFDRALADGTAKAVVDHNLALTKAAQVTGTPVIYANGYAHAGALSLADMTAILNR